MITGPLITGPLITENPFGLPDLVWREGRFSVTQANELNGHGITVCLPESLRFAVPKRQSEYLAGRLCAAHALRAVGLPEAVGQAGRAPIWPDGVVGSISHSDSRVICVVSRFHRGLGVDVEPLMTPAQAQDIHDLILTDAEMKLRPSHLGFEPFLTLMFSAKEAVYKALSPHLLQMPGFLDVTLLDLTPDTALLGFAGMTLTAHYILTRQDALTFVALHPA
jgi:enterobactin synthetase component D